MLRLKTNAALFLQSINNNAWTTEKKKTALEK